MNCWGGCSLLKGAKPRASMGLNAAFDSVHDPHALELAALARGMGHKVSYWLVAAFVLMEY